MNETVTEITEKSPNLDNIAFFFNKDSLNVDSLHNIQKWYSNTTFTADLHDYNQKTAFDESKYECKAYYDYYSELYNFIKDKDFVVESFDVYNEVLNYPDKTFIKSLKIPLDLKMELKKTVDVLGKYYSALSEYESIFDERNY